MKDTTPTTKIVRTLHDGQITIPDAFRRELGIEENSLLQLTLEAGELRVKPIPVADEPQGLPWFRELYDFFAPARQEALEKGYTDEEINGWIDEAIAEVRSERRAKRQ